MWKRGGRDQALGRSRGGLSTKIHVVTGARGQPMRFIFTGGQAADFPQGIPLLSGITATQAIAGRGYDSDGILIFVEGQGATAVIPPRSNRRVIRTYDREVYKRKNLIERAFNKLKNWHRVATRYDRRSLYFMATLQLAAAVIWSTSLSITLVPTVTDM